jgi:hypothetical protein
MTKHLKRELAMLLGLALTIFPFYNGFSAGLTVEQFTNLLATPPTFETLVFKRTLQTREMAFKDEKSAKAFLEQAKQNPQLIKPTDEFFALRYDFELNAFIFRQIKNTEIDDPWNPKNPRLPVFYGKIGTNYWQIHKEGRGTTYINSIDGSFKDENGNTNHFFYYNNRWATEILRFGMFYLLPESFRMIDRTTFSGLTLYGDPVRGTLNVDESGNVTGLEYMLENQIQGNHILGQSIVFDYSGNSSCLLPSKIQIYNIFGSAKTDASSALYCTFEILNCVMPSKKLEPEAFSSGQFLAKDEPKFSFDDKGHSVWIQGTNSTTIKSNYTSILPSKSTGIIMLIIFLAVNIIFLIMLWRSQKKPNRNE